MDMENEVLSPIEPVQTPPPEMPAVPKAEESSYFDGNTWQLIGWRLLVVLLGIVTFGLGAAWGQCMLYRWEAKHTVINGKRLRFDGNGLQLLGKWLLWGLLTLVTFGIYALFIPVAMKKWHTSHLRFSGIPRAPEPAMPVWKIVVMIVAALLVICLVFVALFAIFGYKAEPARIGSDSLWQSSHDQGSSSLEAKDYANAIQAFSSAIEADPDKAQSYIGRAEAYAAMGDMDAALEDMQSAQNKDDGSYDSQIRELMLLLQVLQMESQEQPQKVEPTQTPTEAVQEPQKQETPAQTWYVQAKGGLNLRKEPDKSSKALTTIPNGTAVVVTAWADNGWAQVTYKGHTGWCSGTYLKDEKPASQSGYTWAQVQQAQKDAKKKIDSYRGKNTGKGFTDMTAQKALQFYEDMIQGKYYPQDNVFLEGQLTVIDPPADYYNLYYYQPIGQTFDEQCTYYFSYYADDYAAEKMFVSYGGQDHAYIELDGRCYRMVVGLGDAGVPCKYTLSVQEKNGTFVVTMEVDTYWNGEEEAPEHWTAAHTCFQEDGQWVFDGFTTPYL